MAQRLRAQRVLVVRNDKLGDFMLAWPALATLKKASEALHVTVLVPRYTEAVARACPWVDEVIVDPGSSADAQAQKALLTRMKAARFDALLTLFSTPRIGWLGWRAGIALRAAPATKWAQIFYNLRVRQRRSRSEKPEYRYNVELAEALLTRLGIALPATPAAPPFWPLDDTTRRASRTRLAAALEAPANADTMRLVVVHPGSGGSAVNLDLDQYAALIAQISQQQAPSSASLGWLVSAGPGEIENATALLAQLHERGIQAALFPPSASVVEFATLLAGADLLIAGSTGPLHVAGCLNIATAGFYPARRSATPLRWQTCNAESRRLAFSPPATADERDMRAIDLDAAAQAISALLGR